MVRTRSFDAKAVALQRTGRLGTFASSLGQEAAPVGVASAMRDEDVLLPSFREQGAQLWWGVTPLEFFLYWGGDERGSDFARAREDFPVCVPVGSHAPHAVGVALAFKLRKEKRAAVCIFGDGATSKGDVAEALNVAGVWQLPVVFVVCNNGWAISMPRHRQSVAKTLAQKAIAAGFAGEQVDGNDVVAVHGAVAAALERARGGGGPHLVAEGANIPCTAEAEQALAAQGVLVLPDFIANAGGVICAAVEYRGGTEAAALALIDEKIHANTEAVLDEVRRTGALPRSAAVSLATERVRRAMRIRRWDAELS